MQCTYRVDPAYQKLNYLYIHAYAFTLKNALGSKGHYSNGAARIPYVSKYPRNRAAPTDRHDFIYISNAHHRIFKIFLICANNYQDCSAVLWYGSLRSSFLSCKNIAFVQSGMDINSIQSIPSAIMQSKCNRIKTEYIYASEQCEGG